MDIQAIAVQISKLRFFISLVVEQKINTQTDNLGIRPLPNLETKFVAANTLIGIERPGQQLLRNLDIDAKEAELRKVRKEHFLARTPAKKRKCREQDARLRAEIAELLKADGWDTATARKLASWDPYDQNASATFFDPEWMFGISGGFDAIVGNPPYIDSEGMVNFGLQDLRDYIQSTYTMARGNWDIYIAFYEIGFRLTRINGALSFITPDKWISKPFGDELRKQTIEFICSVLRAGRSVFESVNVDAIICLLTKRRQQAINIFDTVSGEIVFKRRVSKGTLKAPFALDALFSMHYDLLLKLESKNPQLADYGACENACATSDAYKLKPIVLEAQHTSKSSGQLKVINTGTIGKYVSKWGQREMTYLGGKYLRPVVDKKAFQSLFPNSYGKKALVPKLIVKGLNLLDACEDLVGEVIPGKTTLMVTSRSQILLKALLAIINSRLAFFYLKEKYPASSYNEGTTFTKEMINRLPVPKWSDAERGTLVKLVDSILDAKSASSTAETKELEREIDLRVYSLYGLTQDEIRIVEGRSA